MDLLWQHFAGPLFPALLELMVASRTDPELRVVMRQVNDRLTVAVQRQTREIFGESASASRSFTLMMEMTFDLLSGMALRRITWTGDPRVLKRLERDVMTSWKDMASGVLDRQA
jgi:hypothetical protein